VESGYEGIGAWDRLGEEEAGAGKLLVIIEHYGLRLRFFLEDVHMGWIDRIYEIEIEGRQGWTGLYFYEKRRKHQHRDIIILSYLST
jgi:hypothetical protein